MKAWRGLSVPAFVRSTAPPIEEELLEALTVTTYFTHDEICRLHLRFAALDTSNSGRLTKDQLFKLPELEFNQMRARLEAIWATELALGVDFGEFVRLLSPFALGCPREQKFRFAFKVHDADGDGKIGEDDVRGMVSALLGRGAGGGRAPSLEEGPPGGLARQGRAVLVTRAATVAPAQVGPGRRWSTGQVGGGGADLAEELFQKIMDSLCDEVDTDDDRAISFEEWTKVIANTDIVSKLSFNP
ncbi:hypothetical protein T492DRAFT_1028720 [Pavlovales sp. CCMP2436]|nr:hypothetical protein T492DRAFT_1028720 [Pavlovales sp. CCMP2436]